MPLFARWCCGAVISVSKYEAMGHSLGVGIDGHARGQYIQQNDVAIYRITSISCSLQQLSALSDVGCVSFLHVVIGRHNMTIWYSFQNKITGSQGSTPDPYGGAYGAFSDRPCIGWLANSFPMLYRDGRRCRYHYS